MQVQRLSRTPRVGVLGLEKALDSVRPAAPPKVGTGRGRRGFVQDLAPDKLRDIEQRIGTKRAQKIWRLMKRGVIGTLPELCAYEWLERKPWLVFEFQSSQLGGRMISGGAVVDFVIYGLSAEGCYCWRIQGEYWHQGREREANDEAQRVRLLSLRIGGVPVAAVVDLWEYDIYDKYPRVFEAAEFGVELRNRSAW